jgi:OHCU decarboxylase
LNDGLATFNSLPGAEAEAGLYACFAHHGWAAQLASGRPYWDVTALFAAAETAWNELAPSDWLAAFAAHPRIGESGGHSPMLSEGEQSRVMDSAEKTRAALAAENRRYEEVFGHVFLIAARGRTADEILQALRSRLGNDPATELEIAATEQRKITRFRLEQFLQT